MGNKFPKVGGPVALHSRCHTRALTWGLGRAGNAVLSGPEQEEASYVTLSAHQAFPCLAHSLAHSRCSINIYRLNECMEK